jgi:hypothetical protein
MQTLAGELRPSNGIRKGCIAAAENFDRGKSDEQMGRRQRLRHQIMRIATRIRA